ncbi:hypothetical protein Calkr_2336 [Caldicellulosiruptor acetigenus I77R1B]|uniref:Uncharacterized protein n=2 Tax=Caldicellulosiruptor acetigenus TaxID=301953 RepID=G2PVQ7_9FIRM|nr:hypothetical protein [Caldicellulosiruptor acetigenus]ADQ41785.1 hypothetical protein Calkr_2336 [Caldicellulosiruptor acetigenus I77R1B]AEM72801.1 hypothetical protein Calla_0111 [Caldicellulosiruptor acetigenus 6A]
MKKKVWLFSLVVLVSVALVVVSGTRLFKAYKAYHSTPEKAIRFYISIRSGPWTASRVTIEKGSYFDKRYGQQYVVEGYKDRQTGMEIRFFYLQKNRNGLWEVTSAGTGP